MSTRQIAVVGHCCLDLIPTFSSATGATEALLLPGKLVHVGPAHFATGGPVSNVGLTLHRLGVPPLLLGKVGDDQFGRVLLDLYRGYDPSLAAGMIVAPGEPTSYSVVINPPGVDRMFLHCPGANDTFGAEDLAGVSLEGVRLLHFGYPPLMRRIYADDGQELVTLLERVRALGITATLDMARPDPDSEAGKADWRAFLQHVLPLVDVFLPSFEELLYMLDRPQFERLRAGHREGDLSARADGALLSELARWCLEAGAAIVVLKLGEQGLYLRTSHDTSRLAQAGKGLSYDLEVWSGRELLAPCFQANVVGTTGAGDATIAGFLTGLLNNQSPEETMTTAVAVGACSVEALDASSGVPSLAQVQERIAAGWKRSPVAISLPGWRWDAAVGLWHGRNDQAVE